jgi:hypothetical protein
VSLNRPDFFLDISFPFLDSPTGVLRGVSGKISVSRIDLEEEWELTPNFFLGSVTGISSKEIHSSGNSNTTTLVFWILSFFSFLKDNEDGTE